MSTASRQRQSTGFTTLLGVFDDGPMRGATEPELPDPLPAVHFVEDLPAGDDLLYQQGPNRVDISTPEDLWVRHRYQLARIDDIVGPGGPERIAHYVYAPD